MTKPYLQISNKLKTDREKLIASIDRLPVIDFLQSHSLILDSYFQQSFEESMVGPRIGLNKNPYAIIALGGYGREEQCVHSDVDILFLFKKHIPDEAVSLIQEIIYPLWDLGLQVGYATRTLSECIGLARKDYEILTPLLDARFICGMSLLFSELMTATREKILRKMSKKVVAWLVRTNAERHQHFGDSTYLLEPNLKEGQGGLRDYHTMLWIGRIKMNIRQARDLEYFGYLSHDEYLTVTEALSFIWNVRNRLHLQAGRKIDQLYFENQIKLAQSLNFKSTNGLQPVEKFLGTLHSKMDFMKQQHLMFLREHALTRKPRYKIKSKKNPGIESIRTKGDTLEFSSSEAILQQPGLLINIFEESTRMSLPLSAEAKRMVSEFSYLVNNRFRSSETVVESFETVLKEPAPTFNVLREMLNTGFLVKLIPEMKGIANRIQYDEYHLYPVDKHLLRTVQALKRFNSDLDESGCSLCGKIWKGLKNRKLLLWAALLHDIGKGELGKDHSSAGAVITRRILKRFGYQPKDIDTVAFLVQEHLLLVKIATRRDIHDEETAIHCARIIKKISRLQMLYLLTVADCVSTGPNAWNEWTATLLRDFFLKIANVLTKGELATQRAVKASEHKKEIVLASATSKAGKEELEKLYHYMSPRYLLYTPDEEILTDIELYRKLGDRSFVWDISRNRMVDSRTVRICAQDRPGLFSQIAGSFTLNNLDILNAQIFTWRNNLALDIFYVKPPPDKLFEKEHWERAERDFQKALAGDLDLSAKLAEKIKTRRTISPKVSKVPHRIVVDNHSSSFFTIIEVFTYDFPGLLFTVTDALYRAGLDIWVAKISTKVDQVVDVFYVRDFDGQKVDSEEQADAIKAAIDARLPKIV
ncbi:MAG: [protein-PII] uridylyltransferase [Deltaproteobacteria bacterium]|nr:[protein-PII] uridylyltransferase [Deltaproteobacteria bacterium]